MSKFCTQYNSKNWDEIKTVTAISLSIKLMFIGVVEHTCHNTVSCFVKCICGKWWQSSQNVTLFPATLFHWLKYNCLYVSVICIETVFRFNCYDLRALYLYCVLVLIVNVGIIWDFDVEMCEMGEKHIVSLNCNVVR